MRLPTPVQLKARADRLWGKPWLLWEPETIRAELERAPSMPKHVATHSVLCAISGIKKSDAAWHELTSFENVIESLNYIEPDFTEIEGVDVTELYFGVANMLRLREDPKPDFSREVGAYCAAVHLDDGIFAALPPLDFCNEHLKEFQDGRLYKPALRALNGSPELPQFLRGAGGLKELRASLKSMRLLS